MMKLLCNVFRQISVWLLAGVLLGAGGWHPAFAQEKADPADQWPIEIEAPNAKVILYQPQVEAFKGNVIEGRAAAGVVKPGEKEPVFGAFWFTATIESDRETRRGVVKGFKVKKVKFPNATPEQQKKFAALLEDNIPKWAMPVSLDNILASLALAEKESLAEDNLKTTAPRIIFSDAPAVLVTLEGEPKWKTLENASLRQAVNTPHNILQHTETKKYYLQGGKTWYQADALKGPWQQDKNPPAEVVAAIPPPEKKEEADKNETPANLGVVVVTEPSELIITDGQPQLARLVGDELLYVNNADRDVLYLNKTKQYYLLLAGRWYANTASGKDWKYVAPDQLPAVFKKIPADSEKAHVLAHMAGTPQAEEAVLDTHIPQTSTVKLDQAGPEVTFDGAPEFAPISGTSLQYGVNTPFAVVQAKGRYYLCHEAVWYEAESATGPWKVSTRIPDEIYSIPPDCPIYNVKYVRVYSSTPEVVYVGYLPGYMGSYVYRGVVVYGTGYVYPAWYRTYYYPAPVTWGYGVYYNPYYGGWGISVTFGYWGYRNAYYYRYGRPVYGRPGYGRPGYGRPGYGRPGYGRPGHGRPGYGRPGAGRPATRPGPGSRPGASPAYRTPRKSNYGKNNVYVDRKGNVQRRSSSGWQTQGKNGWTPAKPSNSIQRQHQTRQQGRTRTNNFQNHQRRSSPSRGGVSAPRGGSRGGGGRRR